MKSKKSWQKWRAFPLTHVSSSDKEVLRNLERDLKMQVFGQDTRH